MWVNVGTRVVKTTKGTAGHGTRPAFLETSKSEMVKEAT